MSVLSPIRRLGLIIGSAAVIAVAAGLIAAPAAQAAPPPTTTLYNSAQVKFSRGDTPGALRDIGALVRIAPRDRQALALQAIWADYAYDLVTRSAAMARLGAVSPPTAAGVNAVFRAIGAGVATLPSPFPGLVNARTGIAVMGFGLLDNGTIRPELQDRLGAAWLQAIAAPFSPIVVSGGNPRGGITEAAAMRNWLVQRGIPASRIIVESRAGSTVQNALFSAPLLKARGAVNVVVVSSANHVRRVVTDFTIAGLPVVGATTHPTGWVDNLLPPSRDAQRSIYVDATRTFGLPGSR
ncbi:YdcF family protein [Williamsia sp. CHRR-6]|uniref:YdcF family protein n=1 Tax=Williamsia sp. CHRR-6 TaxID=2835871 RepID=UPI001BDABF12|nr:YdcF family protein [Williamsia sp. CHRR-6]MBT0565348.1 YdcF family protein [Williamsia sp. CHRR-6]